MPRLFEVAKEFNIGKETLLQSLLEAGFKANGDGNLKLTDDMYAYIRVKFSQDKAAKRKSDQILIPTSVSKDILSSLRTLSNSPNENNVQSSIKESNGFSDKTKKEKKKYSNRRQQINQKRAVINVTPPLNIVKISAPRSLDGISNRDVVWDNVLFGDGYIMVKINNKWSERYTVTNSQKSFNEIKALYKFREAPNLKIIISGNRILDIPNIQILFYYIQFFKNLGTQFDSAFSEPSKVVINGRHYTKSFYKEYFPTIFLSQCFEHLCSLANETFPIIPVPELIKNTSNSLQIHDSFLFPLTHSHNIYWVWESVEPSKATYIFITSNNNFEAQLQVVFDYITGDTINKRSTIISNNEIRSNLFFLKRILHDNIDTWRYDLWKIARKGL